MNRNRKNAAEYVKKFMDKNVENLNLLLYKAFAFYLDPAQIEKGELDQKKASESFKELLNRVKMPALQLPSFTDARCFRLQTAYRLLCGAGYPTLLENGLLLHHVYGVPYLSGETLKGLARSVFLLSLYGALEGRLQNVENPLNTLEGALTAGKNPELSESIKNLRELPIVFSSYSIKEPYESFLEIFGTLEKRGEVIFYDAFPELEEFDPSKHIEFDIMNPHYPEYYRSQGKEPPADWDNPVPVKFLTVASGVTFRFCLGLAPLGGVKKEKLLQDAEILLRIGLENLGVGGKRRKGYGWFKNSP